MEESEKQASVSRVHLNDWLGDERAIVQEQLDEAMTALRRYSQIKGVRNSDIARASFGPAMLKKKLDAIDAQIAASPNVEVSGRPHLDTEKDK